MQAFLDVSGHALGRYSVLGIECFAGDLETAARAVVERALNGSGGYCCFCNAHVLSVAMRDERVRRALENATFVFPDGAPVAWLQRRIGFVAQRVAGPDLMPLVLERGRPEGLRHFLFGSTPSVLDALRERLHTMHPDVSIVGALSPPLDVDGKDWGRAIDEISVVRPHVVWCALGAPKQELWMNRYAVDLSPALVMGVGAAFDFLAGTKARAPLWMQQHGLEWAHRLVCEPRRLSARYVRTNSEFVGRAALELLRHRQASRGS